MLETHIIVKYNNQEWFISDDPYQLPNYEEGKPVYLDFGSKS
jgi:hypothetical protein